MLRRLPLTGHHSRRAIARSLNTTPLVLDRPTARAGGPLNGSSPASTPPAPSSGPSAYPDADRWGDWNRAAADTGKSKSKTTIKRKGWLDISNLDLSEGDDFEDDEPLRPLDPERKLAADMEALDAELAWKPKGKKESTPKAVKVRSKETDRTRSRDPEDEDGLAPPPRAPKATPQTQREPGPFVREQVPHLRLPRTTDKPHLREMAPWLKEAMERKSPPPETLRASPPAEQPAPEQSEPAPKPVKILFGRRASTVPRPEAKHEPPADRRTAIERDEHAQDRPAKAPPSARTPFGLQAKTPAQPTGRTPFGLRAPTTPRPAARQEPLPDEWTAFELDEDAPGRTTSAEALRDEPEADVPQREATSRLENTRQASPPVPANERTASQTSKLAPRSAARVVPAPMPSGPWKPEWQVLNPANMPPLERRDFLYEGADYKAVFEAAQTLGRRAARREHGGVSGDQRPTFGCPSFVMSALPLKAVKREGAPEQPSPFPAVMHRRQLSPVQRRVRICVVASKNNVSTLAVERRHTRNKFKAAFDLVVNRVREGSGCAPLSPDYVYLVTIKSHLYNVDFVRLCSSVSAGLQFISERIAGRPRDGAQRQTQRRDGPGTPHKAPPRPANKAPGNKGPRKASFGLRSDS